KYKKNNQRWQQLYHQWQDEKKQLGRAKAAAEQLLQQLQRENAALTEKKTVLTQQVQDKQERIQELQRLHQQAQANLEHFRESTRTQRLREQQQAEKNLQELQMQLKELKSQKTREKNELLKLQKQSQAHLQKAQHLKALYQELKQKNETESRKGIDLQTEVRVLTAHLAQVREQLDEALEQNKHLGQEKWVVTKEKSQLEGQLKQLQNLLKKQEA
ncbi:MAG TPA: hypothetical protein VLH77_07335, partial [Gammaproteobacteria bacterium]|nr:hypothetical protein [Gammaproteobacteria bacterium]